MSRPGPGDVVDNALRKCDKEEGKRDLILYSKSYSVILAKITIEKKCQACVTLTYSPCVFLFCSLRVVSSRALQSVHEGVASVSWSASPVAMCPAVPQALQLGAPPPQTHPAAQL